jgi:hypothetical protein
MRGEAWPYAVPVVPIGTVALRPAQVNSTVHGKVVTSERVSRICHALRRIRANDGERSMNIGPAQRYCDHRGGRTPKMFNIIKLIK